MDIQQCGAFITRLRKEHGLTQKQLAEQLGVTDKAISRWETSKGLPDASSLLALSELFSVTVNELLLGRRAETPQMIEAAEENVIEALRVRDREAQKSKHRGLALILIAVFVAASLIGVLAFDILCGNGVTPTTIYDTYRAKIVAHQIASGDYEQASHAIGFINKDRAVEEPQWVARMESLEQTLEIRAFWVDTLIKDDYFISGDALLLVADRVTMKLYLLEVNVAHQDGIVFGGVTCRAGDDERGKELEEIIRKALSTWNAG